MAKKLRKLSKRKKQKDVLSKSPRSLAGLMDDDINFDNGDRGSYLGIKNAVRKSFLGMAWCHHPLGVKLRVPTKHHLFTEVKI